MGDRVLLRQHRAAAGRRPSRPRGREGCLTGRGRAGRADEFLHGVVEGSRAAVCEPVVARSGIGQTFAPVGDTSRCAQSIGSPGWRAPTFWTITRWRPRRGSSDVAEPSSWALPHPGQPAAEDQRAQSMTPESLELGDRMMRVSLSQMVRRSSGVRPCISPARGRGRICPGECAMRDMLERQVTTTERVHLVSALVEYLARSHDVRALHVKGPAAAISLNMQRQSTDVDVMVDPRAAKLFLEVLHAHGFRRVRPAHEGPTGHSVDLLSDHWGMRVDLHLRYPGFGVSDQELFEQLWQGHVTVMIGGWPCRTPDRPAQALLIGLHAARSTPGTLKWLEADTARHNLTQPERQALRAMARDLGAEPVLGTRWRDFSDHATHADRALWAALARKDSAAVWWHRVSSSSNPVREIPQVWRAACAAFQRLMILHDGRVRPAARELLAKVTAVVRAAWLESQAERRPVLTPKQATYGVRVPGDGLDH